MIICTICKREATICKCGHLAGRYMEIKLDKPQKLKRTDPPTEPGLYYCKLKDMVTPQNLRIGFVRKIMFSGKHMLVVSFLTKLGYQHNLDMFAWYGPVFMPETED